MNTTASAIPWLPTTSEVEAAEVSLAEQVAMMLHQERQVLVLITGRDPGRVSGFLAELTHALLHGESVLRIKAALDAKELYPLLAGQLGLPPQIVNSIDGAMQVGERLRAPARVGKYVLVCEAAHSYSDSLLEAIRQLNNYPINIVLCGRPLLLRRLSAGVLRNLRQRVNYRLSLDEASAFSGLKWPSILLVLGLLIYFGMRVMGAPWAPPASAVVATNIPGEPYARIRPAPAPIPAAATLPANTASNARERQRPSDPQLDSDLQLHWETELRATPKR